MDQANSLRSLVGQSLSRKGDSPESARATVISVTSGKGGVGKSSFSVFCARALAARGARVLLFDGDMGLANLHILLGVSTAATLGEYLRGSCSLRDLTEPVSAGIDLLAGLSGSAAAANLTASRRRELTHDLASLTEAYDFIIIDGGAGIGDGAMSLAAAGEYVFLVMMPEPTSLADAYSVMKVLTRRGISSFHTVMNQADSDEEARSVFRQLELISRKYLGIEPQLAAMLPRATKIRAHIRDDRSLLELAELGPFAVRMNSLAQRLMHEHGKKNRGDAVYEQ
ncbi:MAG: AAA family ATPase [Fibrobacterota bacterium]